jgi:spore coat polysaccharide biosynthesis predicted glycosyltransferase SpsG
MTGETLDNALKKFVDEKSDTCISVVNRPHLSWKKDGNCIVPAYEQRLNRQQLPANYFETGAFFITRRENVTPYSRIGKNVSVYEVPEDEATDIDTKDDWQMCESILKRKRIIFRCDGEKKIGMGHIYRCMTLAYNLTGHEVMFVLNEDKKEGIEKIKKSFLPYHLVKNNEEFFEYIQFWNADIVVNDCLDSTYNYMEQLCSKVQRVITFEDLGKGAELADVVINALYDVKNDKVHHYFCGEKYICLRDEFQLSTLGKYNQEVKNILVMFGGTDPSNLTKKIYDIAKSNKEKYPELRYNFILGSGYVNDSIDGIDDYIEVYTDVKRVSDFMRIADLAFTSQGRTVYELASMGIPAIVLAQNEREQLHSFAQMQNGFINLGLGKNVDSPTIESTLEWIIRTPQIRNEMRNLMLSHDLRSGLRRVINLIVDEEF